MTPSPNTNLPIGHESIMGLGASTPLHPNEEDHKMLPSSPHPPNPWLSNIDILYKILTVALLALGSYIAWQVESRVNQLENKIQVQLIDFERRISERFVDRRESEGMEHRIQRLEDRQWPQRP